MLSVFVSAIISAFISFAVAKYTLEKNERENLNSQLDDIIKIAIDHPYFELASFTNAWKSDSAQNNERYAAYEQYATLVFNYLERFCRFFDYDREKIQKELGIKAWILMHKEYWRNPTVQNENTDLYEKKFVDIVEDMLK